MGNPVFRRKRRNIVFTDEKKENSDKKAAV